MYHTEIVHLTRDRGNCLKTKPYINLIPYYQEKTIAYIKWVCPSGFSTSQPESVPATRNGEFGYAWNSHRGERIEPALRSMLPARTQAGQ